MARIVGLAVQNRRSGGHKIREDLVATKNTKIHKKGEAMTINELCDVVRETSFATHKYHRNGHLEKIYDGLLINFGAPKLYVKKYVMD